MSNNRHSVVLFYVTGGEVKNCFAETLVSVLSYDGAHGDLIADARSCEGLYVADNRDRCARRFMRYRLCDVCRNVISKGDELGDRTKPLRCFTCNRDVPNPATPEWMWFMDTDISLPHPNVLERLLASADPVERPIMSALYFGYMDGRQLRPIWYGRDFDGRIVHLKKFGSGVQRLGVVGMGCCLIHRSVFEIFGERYADTGWLYFGHDMPPWAPKPDIWNDMAPFGEDNCFCYRAGELGIPIYGNGSIVVQHRKERYEDLETFLLSIREGSIETDEKGTTARVRTQSGEETISSTGSGMAQPDHAGYQPANGTRHLVGLGKNTVAHRGQLIR